MCAEKSVARLWFRFKTKATICIRQKTKQNKSRQNEAEYIPDKAP